MAVYAYEHQGGFHQWENCPCQDSVRAFQSGDVECVTLCDGAGSLARAQETAEAFAQVFSRWLAENFTRLLRSGSDDAVRALVITRIDQLLTQLTGGKEAARAQFGCTLLSVCRNRRTGEALVMQLGDGVILSWNHDNGCHCLLRSEQGEEHRSTWLVNHHRSALEEHLQVLRLRPRKAADAYCLLSDGGEGPLYRLDVQGTRLHPILDKMIPEYLMRPSSFAETMPGFVQKQLRPADDFSIGIIGDAPAALFPPAFPPRSTRRFALYLSARRAGLSRIRAARQAGWRKRDLPRRLEQLTAFTAEEA